MKVKTRVKTADKILALLAKDSTLSLIEISEYLSVAKSTVERTVAKLKKEGKLTYVGPKKNDHWQLLE
ncbi:HTH domain-containing protein [Vibrio gangliei]|uniref:HTH domain-containing protein n=1 Tax=Vibrio gangliei TaxID=2077090 RepID=UPI001B80C31A|nr:DeoR family transcriptional regulator [Vibrio gangliei]